MHFDESSEVNRYRGRRKAVHLPAEMHACAHELLGSKLAVG